MYNIESKIDHPESLLGSQGCFAALKALAEGLREKGFPLYVVGGAVRNSLMGIPVSDIDICSAARPQEIMELCSGMGFKCVQKAIEFGTIEIHAGKNRFEYTTFRSDSYGEGGRHRPEAVKFTLSLEEDARRRDFTINALYCGVCDGTLHDPTGGLEDLKNGVIRAASREPYRVLNDDGLRIMRMVRFAAELGFDIDKNTFETARALRERLRDVSAERIRDELNKILLSDIKYSTPPRRPCCADCCCSGTWELSKCCFGSCTWATPLRKSRRITAMTCLNTLCARLRVCRPGSICVLQGFCMTSASRSPGTAGEICTDTTKSAKIFPGKY